MRESTLVSFEPSQISIQSPMILGQFKGPLLLKFAKKTVPAFRPQKRGAQATKTSVSKALPHGTGVYLL
jgi:hypothetical protein